MAGIIINLCSQGFIRKSKNVKKRTDYYNVSGDFVHQPCASIVLPARRKEGMEVLVEGRERFLC